ncbi:IS3 family transposase [Streptomyces carminius]
MSDGTYGYRRVHAQLLRWGVAAGPELVRRLLRRLGLMPCQPGPRRWSLTRAAPGPVPDLVGRDFTADAPWALRSSPASAWGPTRKAGGHGWTIRATPFPRQSLTLMSCSPDRAARWSEGRSGDGYGVPGRRPGTPPRQDAVRPSACTPATKAVNARAVKSSAGPPGAFESRMATAP